MVVITDFSLVAVPLGCLALTGWQFWRANNYRQRLMNTLARHEHDQELTQRYLKARLLRETGTGSLDEFITAWQQLNYRLGYALHHIEDFDAPLLLKRQLVTIASLLRTQAKTTTKYQPLTFWHKSPPAGGFREMVSGDEDEIERDVRLLIDGLDNWQLAGICCYIMDGYYLEGAFYKVGICIYSPTGKASVLGQKNLNGYGLKLHYD